MSRVVAESAAFISSVVLARLITPDEFGRTAAAIFLSAIAYAVSQQGIGSFLVSHASPTPAHFRVAALASFIAGALGTALTLLISVTLAPQVFGDRAARFIALSSPVWLLACIRAVPTAQLQRSLSFGPLALIEAATGISTATVAVGLALFGVDGEALVLGALAGAAASCALACAFSRLPRAGWSANELRDIGGFGGPVLGASILYTAVRNIDYVLLAAFIPAFQVGLYMRAFSLGSDYQAKISQILLNVAFPVFARATDLDEIRRMRARMIRVHATVLFPLLFGLIAVAPQFVPWLFGPHWAAAAGLTQILAVGGMLAAVGTGTGPLLVATGHPRAILVYNLVAFVAYTAAVLASIPFGLTAVCVAVVLVRLITFVTLQRIIVERRVGIPILETVRDDIVPAVSGGVPLLVITMLGMRLGLELGVPVFVAMAVPGVLGLAVYVAILRAFFPATWDDVQLLTARLRLRSFPRLTVGGRRRHGR